MANSTRPQVSEPKLKDEDINPLTLDKVEGFYETNKKMINNITIALLVVIGGYYGYTYLYKKPSEEKAATALSMAQRYFEVDSLNLAMNGDGKNLGFTKISKKYGGTGAGNLAHYYEGVCFLKMGDPASAIKSLKEFNGKGTLLEAMAAGVLGQAYMESGDAAKAIESFKKATADKDDNLVTPMYLYHMGLAYATSGKTNEAKETFKRIRDEYPKSIQARDMDKELARLGEVN